MPRKTRKKRLVVARDAVPIDIPRESWSQFAGRFRWTKREAQIAQLLLEDRLEKQIAAQLRITENTLHTHIGRLYAKMNVHNRTGFSHAIFSLFFQLSRRRNEPPPL